MSTPSRKARRRRQRIAWTAVGGIAFVIIVWSAVASYRVSAQRATVVEPTLVLGKELYAVNCAACHGVDLEGEPDWQRPDTDGTMKAPPHDETGHTWHHGDSYLMERIRYGTRDLDAQTQAASDMPGYADVMSEDEMHAILEYIKSTWPADIQAVQAERTAAETR